MQLEVQQCKSCYRVFPFGSLKEVIVDPSFKKHNFNSITGEDYGKHEGWTFNYDDKANICNDCIDEIENRI